MADSESVNEDFSDAALRETLSTTRGFGIEFGLDQYTRFKANVARLVQRRSEQADASLDGYGVAVFLLSPDTSRVSVHISPRVPMVSNGRTSLNGRIWFLSEQANSGYFHQHDIDDDETLFRLVEELGFGSTHAVVYDPRLSNEQLRFYQTGLEQPDQCDVVDLAVISAQVEPVDVKLTLDQLYTRMLVTPDAKGSHTSLWSDASSGYPKENTEEVIQELIRATLIGKFLLVNIRVRSEQSSPVGRLDILIEDSRRGQNGSVVRHGTLELKVLRSFSESGKTRYSQWEADKAIRTGLEQADAYRDDVGARWTALCCFDLRLEDSGDHCFSAIRVEASNLRVLLWRWFLYRSSIEYRHALSQTKSVATRDR